MTARALAPVDLTGVWVSVVTEDWRAQVEPEGKSQHPAIPLSPAGLSRVNARNPVKDETAAEACRGYGAPGVMRAPGRIRINWDNDNTLRIDTEAGTQTRLLRFAPAAATAEPTWQGESRAEWQTVARAPHCRQRIAERHAEGDHASPETRLPAEERRRVWTGRRAHGILRAHGGTERRYLAGPDRDR